MTSQVYTNVQIHIKIKQKSDKNIAETMYEINGNIEKNYTVPISFTYKDVGLIKTS